MDDGVHLLLAEEVRQPGGITDITDHPARTLQYAIGRDGIEIENDHAVTEREQVAHRVRADVPGSSGHKDAHGSIGAERVIDA